MKWIVVTSAALLILIALVFGVGYLLPPEHTATRSLTLPHPPERVWALISDYAGQPRWRAELSRVEILADAGGARVREIDRHGDAITYETVAAEPPRRLVRRIADDDLPFGGTWTLDIAATATGSTLTISERGTVHNPMFRFLSRFVFGHTASMDAYLAALEQALAAGG